MAKTKIEIFTRPGCGYCVAAKRLLVQHDLSFTEYDLSVPEHSGSRANPCRAIWPTRWQRWSGCPRRSVAGRSA